MAFVKIEGISKAFGATKALTDVSLQLERGEIHGLLGENGAGKSTLMKVLSGMVMPDEGSVEIDGVRLRPGKPKSATAAGVGIAYQELSSPPNINIATKLCWPEIPRGPLGLISTRRTLARARQILAQFDARHIDPTALIAQVDLATRQQVEIIAAMSRLPKLLVLDEPTAALPDTAWLFAQLRDLKARGSSVVYISHKLTEIEAICDRGTVLRSGRTVGAFERGDTSDDELVELMIGRSFEQTFPAKRDRQISAEPVLTAREIAVAPSLHNASVTVGQGEIVGVAGLEGQGQRELLYGLAGLAPLLHGTVQVAAGDGSVGTALVPEERKTEALFLEMSSAFNMTVASMSSYTVGPYVSNSRQRQLARQVAASVNLPPQMVSKKISSLSGGNQQKVVFGRAISQDPQCLILFDPTRGVDAGTKLELYDMARKFATNGRGILMYSTEIPELVGLCDRVYTIHGGRITGEFVGDDVTETAIMGGALNWKGGRES